jgi:hypothetical protein
MNKLEFKKLYSEIRKENRDFKDSTWAMACGDDDAAYERYEDGLSKYLADKPALKYALQNSWELTREESRQQAIEWMGEHNGRLEQRIYQLKYELKEHQAFKRKGN